MMTESKSKRRMNTGKDWAILPFDEKEDDERWAKFIAETGELAEKVAGTEAVFGELLTEENLTVNQSESDFARSEQSEEEKLVKTELF